MYKNSYTTETSFSDNLFRGIYHFINDLVTWGWGMREIARFPKKIAWCGSQNRLLGDNLLRSRMNFCMGVGMGVTQSLTATYLKLL